MENFNNAVNEAVNYIRSLPEDQLNELLEKHKNSEFAIVIDNIISVIDIQDNMINGKSLDDDFQKVLSDNLLELF